MLPPMSAVRYYKRYRLCMKAAVAMGVTSLPLKLPVHMILVVLRPCSHKCCSSHLSHPSQSLVFRAPRLCANKKPQCSLLLSAPMKPQTSKAKEKNVQCAPHLIARRRAFQV